MLQCHLVYCKNLRRGTAVNFDFVTILATSLRMKFSNQRRSRWFPLFLLDRLAPYIPPSHPTALVHPPYPSLVAAQTPSLRLHHLALKKIHGGRAGLHLSYRTSQTWTPSKEQSSSSSSTVSTTQHGYLLFEVGTLWSWGLTVPVDRVCCTICHHTYRQVDRPSPFRAFSNTY